MKRTIKDWLKVLVLLLDEAAVVALAFLVIWALDIDVPLPITIVGALLIGALAFVMHKAVIPTFHKKQVTGAEGLVGLEAEVTEPLTPRGVVQLKGEYWKAKSVSEDIEAGEEVEVLGMEGLTLKVKRKGE
ncbi:NfeD family protein [Chloroflexota bacterium]